MEFGLIIRDFVAYITIVDLVVFDLLKEEKVGLRWEKD